MNNTEQVLTVEQIDKIVQKLGGYEGALSLLRGETEIKLVIKPIIINCDADPRCYHPDHCVKIHKRNGKFIFDPSKIELLLWEEGVSYNHFLQNLPKDRVILNANVLDYLLNHLRLIPESWESKDRSIIKVVFMGTIFFDTYDENYWFNALEWSYTSRVRRGRMIWENWYHEFLGYNSKNSSSVFVPVAKTD